MTKKVTKSRSFLNKPVFFYFVLLFILIVLLSYKINLSTLVLNNKAKDISSNQVPLNNSLNSLLKSNKPKTVISNQKKINLSLISVNKLGDKSKSVVSLSNLNSDEKYYFCANLTDDSGSNKSADTNKYSFDFSTSSLVYLISHGDSNSPKNCVYISFQYPDSSPSDKYRTFNISVSDYLGSTIVKDDFKLTVYKSLSLRPELYFWEKKLNSSYGEGNLTSVSSNRAKNFSISRMTDHKICLASEKGSPIYGEKGSTYYNYDLKNIKNYGSTIPLFDQKIGYYDEIRFIREFIGYSNFYFYITNVKEKNITISRSKEYLDDRRCVIIHIDPKTLIGTIFNLTGVYNYKTREGSYVKTHTTYTYTITQ